VRGSIGKIAAVSCSRMKIMQRLKDIGPFSRWLCCSHSIAFLASLPILFSTANGQQRDCTLRRPHVLSAAIISSARPLPLPHSDVRTVPVSSAVSCKANGDVDESRPVVYPVALERLPPVDHQSGSIFGTWKSFASCLHLFRDGRIEIEVDVPRDAKMKHAASERWSITGQYESRDDLLSVQWNDGSRSNFRWQLRDEMLLLTDENGQTSQLSRGIK
jgi:hypothetical protein